MKKDTIYIDNDDEITSITDKVQTSKSPIVALVLPKRCTVLQSTVNMKILNRAASAAGKNVVLITSEAALLPVAGAAGMFVAKTLQSKPAVPETPNYDDQVDEVIEDTDDTPIDATKSIGELAGATAVAAMAVSSDDTPIELGDETPDKSENTKKDKKKTDKKDRKLKVPNFDSFRVKLFAVIGGIGLLIVAWYVMTVVMPRAVVTIFTENNSIPVSMTITGSPAAKTIDVEKQIVPAETKTMDKTETKKFAATGEKNVGTKATGKVTFYNCNIADKLGDISRTVPAGTGISSGGFTFISQAEVTVLPSGFSGSTCKFDKPSAEISVVAQEPGDKYNVSAREYAVAGFPSMTADDKKGMGGGVSKIIKVVSASDCDTAKNELLNTKTDEYKTLLAVQLTAAGLTPIKDTFTATPGTVICNPAVDVEATEATATVTFKLSMMGVNTAALNQLVQTEVSKKLEPSQTIFDTGVKTATLTTKERKSNGDVVFSLTTDAQTGIKQDPDAIAKSIAGKKRGESTAILRAQPGVKEVKIEYTPFWVSATPKNTKHITVKFVNNGTN